MESTYEPVSGTLELLYDPQAQKVFNQASKKLTPLFDFHSSPLRKMLGEEADEDIGAPLRLLAALGTSSSRKLQVRPLAMQNLLDLTCWLMFSLNDSGKPVKPLDNALILLSNVTPISILPGDLPPASEVFDKKTTNPGAWKAYETIRLWEKTTMPHLYAIQMYFLLQELKRLRNPISSLKSLMSSLDASTFLLCKVMEVLALKEISETTSKRRKK